MPGKKSFRRQTELFGIKYGAHNETGCKMNKLCYLLAFTGLCCVLSCRSYIIATNTDAQKIPLLNETNPPASGWSWSLSGVDTVAGNSDLVKICLHDHALGRSETAITFQSARQNKKNGLWYLVFEGKDVFDLVVVYIYDPSGKRFIGKFYVNMA
jgi:hypothetical protein